jgi:hypothetical protein
MRPMLLRSVFVIFLRWIVCLSVMVPSRMS